LPPGIAGALLAQKQAAKDQRQRDEEAERRTVEGTLRAIATELRVLKKDAFDPLGEKLKKRDETYPVVEEEFYKNRPPLDDAY